MGPTSAGVRLALIEGLSLAYCVECGVRRGARYQLDDLIVEEHPICAFWRGEPLDLNSMQIQILLLLLKSSCVTQADLVRVISVRGVVASVRVRISQLRSILPKEIEIVSVHGKGYQLRVASNVVGDVDEPYPAG